MKKLFLFCIAFATFNINAQVVNIPDTNFRNALINDTLINTNKDASIQVSEAQAITRLNFPARSIVDMTGIEAFINLTDLILYNNYSLPALDLSANTKLKYLDCGGCALTSLNVSANTQLTHLECYNNQLTALNISSNINLDSLGCSGNKFKSFDLSFNTKLTLLGCGQNKLTSLDISKNTQLKQLLCNEDSLVTLNVSANSLLTRIECYGNHLSVLDVSNNTELFALYAPATPVHVE